VTGRANAQQIDTRRVSSAGLAGQRPIGRDFRGGAVVNGLSRRDWMVIAFFVFVTAGTALVILNWLMGWV
jgi:hypothetical protein